MSDVNHTSHEEVKEIVHNELAPIKKEFSSMKNYAMTILILAVGSLFGYGIWVGTIQQRVSSVELNQDKFEQRIEGRLIRIEEKIDKLK